MTRQWPNGSSTIPEVTSEYGGEHSLTGYHRGIDLIGFAWNRAADDGVVIMAGWNSTAGVEVRILHDDGYITRYLHNAAGSLQVYVGERVARGDALGLMGDTGYVTGKHLHFEVICPDGVTRINPRDYISAGAPAGGDAKPFPTELTRPPVFEEDNTMLMLILKGGAKDHLVALSDGIFRHFLPSDPYQVIMQVSRSADDWQDLGISALPALLRTYGCDLNIWDFRDGRDLSRSVSGTDPNAVFVVLDPLDGSVKPGNMWSAAGAVRSRVEQVKITSEQTAAYIAKLALK